jgi:hypothetical protein
LRIFHWAIKDASYVKLDVDYARVILIAFRIHAFKDIYGVKINSVIKNVQMDFGITN